MIKVIFMGTPDIAVNSFEKLLKYDDIQMLCAVTMPDRPKGRGKQLTPPPIKISAQNNNIEVLQTPSISKDRELIEKIKSLNPDLIITFAFGQLLSQEVIDIPKFGIINLHASLLPKYRGANPIQHAVLNGDKETGITTMKTVLKMDAGDILETQKIQITDNMNTLELIDIISEKSPELLYSTIKGLYDNKIIPIKQNEEEVTFAPKIDKEFAKINFNTNAQDFHNKVRGLVNSPVANITVNGKTVKILETLIADDNSQGKTGEILSISKDGITVKCLDGAIILKTVCPENRSKMPAYDFANGLRLKTGDILE